MISDWHSSLEWLRIANKDLDTERKQCEEEGRDISSVLDEFDSIKNYGSDFETVQLRAQALLDKTIALPIRDDYPYDEPSDIESIQASRPAQIDLPKLNLSSEALFDKIYGAWLGRCAGCMLGKPAEGRRSDQIEEYLKTMGRWPLSEYFSTHPDPEISKKCGFDSEFYVKALQQIEFAVEDDDTNYTTSSLAIVSKSGRDFTPFDVAAFWLQNIPALHTCTAERVAYRNLLSLIPPPHSAALRNPYREWIGAQIRTDFYGYINPGNPEIAAHMGWRDASISHVKNGIYGAMWVSAMNAAAFVSDDMRTIIRTGLSQIPASSRFYEAIERIIGQYESGFSYDDAITSLYTRWNQESPHDWCHTISNAEIVAIALLWGERDFTRTICYAVQPGFDTDCNGATSGSVIGMVLGAGNIPSNWTQPLNDTLETGVAGYYRVKISDLAKKTLDLI